MVGIEKVTKTGDGNNFRVKHYGGLEYDQSAEIAAGVILEEINPFLDNISAGLSLLVSALQSVPKIPGGGLDQWQVFGIIGLIRGLQARTEDVDLNVRSAIDVLKAFSDFEKVTPKVTDKVTGIVQ